MRALRGDSENPTMPDPNESVRSALESLVDDGSEIGAQVAAYLDGDLAVDAWAGSTDESNKRPVDGDSLFTGFSISKGITATCIHILADRGLVDYDAPIARYWPEFAARGKGRATVRHALTHRVGIPQDPPGFDLATAGDWDAICRAIADLEPLWEPGTRIGYHPLTYGWMLGEVVRRVDGRPIAEFLQDEVCRPLGIDAMFFGVPLEAERRVATLKVASTEVGVDLSSTPSLSDPAAAFNRSVVRRAVIPGAGAIMNARSLARHYAMLSGGGELAGVRVVSRERVALATAPQPEDAETALVRWWTRHGLGYTLGGGPGPTEGRSAAFGYEGIGTIGFADPTRRFSFAFLKNRLDLSSDGEMRSVTRIARVVEQALGV
jgi:CubicO group peptidase (beta-lactamase class C family)